MSIRFFFNHVYLSAIKFCFVINHVYLSTIKFCFVSLIMCIFLLLNFALCH